MFHRSAYSDYSRSNSAFTTERNLDAKRAKKCLRPTQVPSQDAWIFYPPGALNCLRAAFDGDSQKIRGGPRPRVLLAHELPHARGDLVGVDHTLNYCPAIGRASVAESAGGPEGGLAGGCPEREVGHSW